MLFVTSEYGTNVFDGLLEAQNTRLWKLFGLLVNNSGKWSLQLKRNSFSQLQPTKIEISRGKAKKESKREKKGKASQDFKDAW